MATPATITDKMYVCYSYYDYHKEFEVKMLKAFARLEDACAHARSISNLEDDSDTEYVCHKGQHYDHASADGGCDRIAVDSVDAHVGDQASVTPGATMYAVYGYCDYRKENNVEAHAVFADLEAARAFAATLTDGEVSEPDYACSSGQLFDQRAKEGYHMRIAVDPIIVG